MKCPKCGGPCSEVIDSRPSPGLERIRRRRECLSVKCKKRWTTLEVAVDSLCVMAPMGRLALVKA